MKGSLSCLNVAGGDVRVTFNKDDVSELIRAKRIITDMLARGYALLVEVDGAYQRAIAFDEAKSEYIIADYDPKVVNETVRAAAVAKVRGHAEVETPEEESQKSRRGRKRRVPMASTNAVGVARSAGG